MHSLSSRIYTFVSRRATQALAVVLAISILGCGLSPSSEFDGDDNHQVAALAIPLAAPAAAAAAAISIPAVVVVAAAAVVAVPIVLILMQRDYETIEPAIRAGLSQWINEGMPADRDWYVLAYQAAFSPSDAAEAEFAGQFAELSSPRLIASLSNPYHEAYGAVSANPSLAQIAALHSAVLAHIATPQTMVATARVALVPGFMTAQTFAANQKAIVDMFSGYQATSFQGVTDADLAQHTVQELTALSGMLQSATGALTRTLAEQAIVKARVHAAFLTGIILAASTVNASLFPAQYFPAPLHDLVANYSEAINAGAADQAFYLSAIQQQLATSFGPNVTGLRELHAQVFFDAEYSFDLDAYIAEAGLVALSTQLQNLALVEIFRLYPELKIPLVHLVKPKSAGQMQREVEKGNAPREVDRVDGAHQEGQQPHVHVPQPGGKDVSINQDGTLGHDADKLPEYRTGNKLRKWLTGNGWGDPVR